MLEGVLTVIPRVSCSRCMNNTDYLQLKWPLRKGHETSSSSLFLGRLGLRRRREREVPDHHRHDSVVSCTWARASLMHLCFLLSKVKADMVDSYVLGGPGIIEELPCPETAGIQVADRFESISLEER